LFHRLAVSPQRKAQLQAQAQQLRGRIAETEAALAQAEQHKAPLEATLQALQAERDTLTQETHAAVQQ
jgi:chromosome segregation ATPase